MRETDPVAVELEDTPLAGQLDVGDGGRRERLEQRHRRSGERGHGDERLAHLRGQRAEPLRDEGAKALGQKDVDTVGADRAVGQRAPDLEREERVPARGLVHSHEHRPGQVERQPTPQEPVDRPDRQRRNPEPTEPREGAVELERRLDRQPAHRRQYPDRLALQPPEHEAEEVSRARIDPLRIVDREEERALLDQDAHDREKRRRDESCLGRRPVGLADQERDLQRTPLDGHEPRQRLLQDWREQVGDGREARSAARTGLHAP